MRHSQKIIAATTLAAVISSGFHPLLAATAPAYVTAAVASVGRPPDDMARDVNRKPAETVAFANVKPGNKVLELLPGRGYYTRILSKVVGVRGQGLCVRAGAASAAPRNHGRPTARSNGAG